MLSDIFDTSFCGVSTVTWLAAGTCLALVYRFARRGGLLVQLPGPPRENWKIGHFGKLFGLGATAYHEHLVSTYGPTMKIHGAFGEEVVWTCDPALMHVIFVKDRAKFERSTGNNLMLKSIFGGGLLSMTGEYHRTHRKLLNPVFTMKFLRELMPIFMDIAEQTCDGIKKELSRAKSSNEIDVFPWATAAALELVGEAGLGYSLDSFTGQRNEYNTAIKSVLRVVSTVTPYAKILPFAYKIGTPAFRRWALQYLPITGLKEVQRVVSIQHEQANEIIASRQALLSSGEDLSSQAGRGRDIMTLLMKASEAEGSENRITRQDMIGHMNTFVFAGHETTSTAVSRILNILADYPQVQVKLREEIKQYFGQNQDDVNHDGLLELPYLDGVVRETLRLHGPVVSLTRINEQDTVVPLQYPVETPNGVITSIPLKKGTRIITSIYMANRYTKIWGDRANDFLPERWIGSKLEDVTQAGAHLPGVYSSIMSFGAGPTSCIGFKFAVLEIKVTVAALVRSFKFEPSHLQPSHWEAYGVQFPYLNSEQSNPDKLPKLPLRVIAL